MKKGQIIEGRIEKVEFPNKGILFVDGQKIIVKNTIAGQLVQARVSKLRAGKKEAALLEVLERAEGELTLQDRICPHFGACGGCTYQNLSYQAQLTMKQEQVKELLDSVITTPYEYEPIHGSPRQFEYRNKMEFSFGDEVKDGPLALGLHKRGSMYDIVSVKDCRIVDKDFRAILRVVLNFYVDKGIPFYRKMRHEGVLRHLLVRKSVKTGQILVVLVTSGRIYEEDGLTEIGLMGEMPEEMNMAGKTEFQAEGYGALADYLKLAQLKEELVKLPLEGTLTGFLHTVNNSLSDVVQSDFTKIWYGTDVIQEELLGLKFNITPFSFFQTNSLGAEVLYSVAREYIGNTKDKLVFDLYSGTGTIAQMVADVAKKVIGVEIVGEAVEAAKQNAALNGLTNCEFIAGDVLKVLDEIEDKPDLIILDPPRDGIHPKALSKIIRYGVENIVYISCKPTSLVRDLEVLQEAGYRVVKGTTVDMFCGTGHVETVALLTRKAQ